MLTIRHKLTMRKNHKIPRILKLYKVEGFSVTCVFNTGEFRKIDFEPLFIKWKLEKDPFQKKLMVPDEFSQVEVIGGTLTWPNITKTTKLSNGMEFNVSLDLDPLVLYEASIPDEDANKRYKIGAMLKQARLEAGLTQEELAKRSGTTKNYISRIENDRSTIEVNTLIKIIEVGLGRKLKIEVA